MIRRNLILLYTEEFNYVSKYIHGSFEPECILSPLKEIIVKEHERKAYRHCITSLKNLTIFDLNSKIIVEQIQNFEFNPIYMENSKVKGFVKHLYAINTTDEYKTFKVIIDAEEILKDIIANTPKEVTVPPKCILLMSINNDNPSMALHYEIKERVDISA